MSRYKSIVDPAWRSYTPVISSNTGGWTNVTLTGMYRVVNKMLEVSFEVSFSAASAAASAMYISLPSAHTIDTAALAGGGGIAPDPAGFAVFNDSGTISGVPGIINTRDTTRVLVKYTDDDEAGKIIGQAPSEAAPWTWANGDNVLGRFAVPVL